MNQKRIIIVGGNAAGPSAAAKAKRVDPNAEVIMFEAGDFISTGTCELPYLISGDIDDYKKIVFFDEDSFLEKKGVKVFTKHRVENINRINKSILVRDLKDNTEKIFTYDKLILCTGSTTKRISSFGSNLENVFYLKSVNDYLQIKDFCDNNSINNVLIIGASFIGLEAADAFKMKGKKVSILEAQEYPMPNSELEIQHLIADTLREHEIEFIGNAGAAEYLFENNKVKSVKIDGKTKKNDLVLVSIGVAPNVSLALKAKLNMGAHGGLKVDNKQKTSDPNIFAAGDNCEVVDKISNRPSYMPIATIAHQQGHIAGANAAGAFEISKPLVKNIAVKIFDKTYSSVGLSIRDLHKLGFRYKSVTAVTNNIIKVMPDSSKVFGKIIFNPDTKFIYGAEFFGREEVIGYADIISSLIQNNVPGNKLSEISFNYTPPRSPFINLLSILGRKIQEESS
ncbi:MAG: FAD-dependent oxidoreductase [Bacteroidota bacterium]